jgi:hypothetical protein
MPGDYTVNTPAQVQASDTANVVRTATYTPAAADRAVPLTAQGNHPVLIETVTFTLTKRTPNGHAGSVTYVGGKQTSYTPPT